MWDRLDDTHVRMLNVKTWTMQTKNKTKFALSAFPPLSGPSAHTHYHIDTSTYKLALCHTNYRKHLNLMKWIGHCGGLGRPMNALGLPPFLRLNIAVWNSWVHPLHPKFDGTSRLLFRFGGSTTSKDHTHFLSTHTLLTHSLLRHLPPPSNVQAQDILRRCIPMINLFTSRVSNSKEKKVNLHVCRPN